jgi:hypothetical protein
MSRDQLISLGYFTSVTRANTRLRELRCEGFIRRLETPFFGQSLYMARWKAADITGNPVRSLLKNRSQSPRFLQHALAVTNLRIKLTQGQNTSWRFEQQLWTTFDYAGRSYEVRPDGLALVTEPTVVEVDLGHVSPKKFAEKLKAYDAFTRSGMCRKAWQFQTFTLLVVTTGKRRASSLRSLLPESAPFAISASTLSELGLPLIGSWS